MRAIMRATGLLIGGVLFAAVLYALLAVPGFISDRDSLVPPQAAQVRR